MKHWKIKVMLAAWLFPLFLFAQKNTPLGSTFAPDSTVYRLFEKRADVKWIKHFSGRLDDVSDVDITLGSDGKNCRGFLTYTESRDRLRLDGNIKGPLLTLREINAANETTGNLRGAFVDKHFDADWTSADNTLGSRLETEEVSTAQIGMSHCGDNKWISRYAAAYNGGRFELALSRANNGQLYGSAWTESDNRTYVLRGEIKETGAYNMTINRRDGTTAGQLRGTMRFLQNLDAQWITPAGNKLSFNFYLKETLTVGCYEFADFSSSYDVLYPKTKCAACNTWTERQVTTWVAACKGNFAAKKQPQTPANRASRRASGWSDIALWTDDLFCGTLTFVESWNDKPQGQAFNFDLKTGREITLNDLFIKNFDARTWLDAYIKSESPKLPTWTEPAVRYWLEKEGFPLFVLRRDGVALSSNFHPIFGQQTILVPYATLKPYLRKDSPVSGFVK